MPFWRDMSSKHISIEKWQCDWIFQRRTQNCKRIPTIQKQNLSCRQDNFVFENCHKRCLRGIAKTILSRVPHVHTTMVPIALRTRTIVIMCLLVPVYGREAPYCWELVWGRNLWYQRLQHLMANTVTQVTQHWRSFCMKRYLDGSGEKGNKNIIQIDSYLVLIFYSYLISHYNYNW